MNCPRGCAVLKTEMLYDVHIDVCPRCHGVWLDVGELPILVQHFSVDRQKVYESWREQTGDGKTAPQDFWSETRDACPKDGQPMSRHFFAGNSGVGIEQCQQCRGFWFDGNELQAVAKTLEPNPELDAAIAGAARGMREEFEDDFDADAVRWVDMYQNPGPHLANGLVNVLVNMMIAVVTGR